MTKVPLRYPVPPTQQTHSRYPTAAHSVPRSYKGRRLDFFIKEVRITRSVTKITVSAEFVVKICIETGD